MSGIYFSIVRGLVEGEEEEEGSLSKEAPSSFFSRVFCYVYVHVVNPTITTDIILISSMEEDLPCKYTWSINCCWDGNSRQLPNF